MVKKVDELEDLIKVLEHHGISFEHGSGCNNLKIAYNPEWDKSKNTLYKYVITSANDRPLNFSFSNKKNSSMNYMFSYGWVTIFQINEPNQRKYSVHVIKEGEDSYPFLDYVVMEKN